MKLFRKIAAAALAAVLALTVLAGCSGSSVNPEEMVMNHINASRQRYGKTAIQNDPELKKIGEDILAALEANGTKTTVDKLSGVSQKAAARLDGVPLYGMDYEKLEQLVPAIANKLNWNKGIMTTDKGVLLQFGWGLGRYYPDQYSTDPAREKQVWTLYPFEFSEFEEAETAQGGEAIWSMCSRVGFATREIDGYLRYVVLVEK